MFWSRNILFFRFPIFIGKSLIYSVIISQMQKLSISAFIDKTWTMLESNSFSEVVRWTEDGNSFRIIDEAAFEKDVLPIYFKHSNLTSFQRQVKMLLFSSTCITSTRRKLNLDIRNTITVYSKDIIGKTKTIQRVT